jgi:hypothetical protein
MELGGDKSLALIFLIIPCSRKKLEFQILPVDSRSKVTNQVRAGTEIQPLMS